MKLNSMILLRCHTGKLVEAEEVLREMISQGAFPDNVCYTTLINGFNKMEMFLLHSDV